MKIIKKSIIALFIALILLICALSSACETNRAKVIQWDFNSCISLSIDTYLGIPFIYEFENATIEISNSSDNGFIVFNQFTDVKDKENYSDYEPYYKRKKVSLDECPFEYRDADGDMLWWVPVGGWYDYENRGERKVSDYIYFIARRDDKIVGYAVIYVWTDGENGGGKTLADKECSDMSETEVKHRIQKVIDEHKD